MNVLHISHTDIRYDSRILKEMTFLNSLADISVHGLGVVMREGNIKGKNFLDFNISLIDLCSREFRMPKVLRLSLEVIEFSFKTFLSILKTRPKIIHCHDLTPLPVCVLSKIFFSFKLIYDAHELESDKAGSSNIISKVTYFFENILIKHVDFFITVSPSIIEWYKRNYSIKNSAVILNSPLFSDSVSSFNERYLREKFCLLDEKAKIFIYVGFLSDGRNIQQIIDYFANAQLHHLVILGYGPLFDDIGALASENSFIHLHEPVAHENVVDIVKSADYGFCMIQKISLSDYFSLPNKIFEYAFAKIPVIASDFPDIKHFLYKHNIGICCKEGDDLVNVLNVITTHNFNQNPNIHSYSWENQTTILKRIYNYLIFN